MSAILHPFDVAWRALHQPSGTSATPFLGSELWTFEKLQAYFRGQTPTRWLLSVDRELEGKFPRGGVDGQVGQPLAAWMLEGLKPTNETDERSFQIKALSERGLRGSCPFTGRAVVSRRSFAVTRQVIFYRFDSPEVYYVATAHIGNGFTRNAYYFPLRDLLVRVDEEAWGVEREHVALLKALMVGAAGVVADYLGGDYLLDERMVLIGHPNFAHHLMNELAALQAMVERRLLGLIDQLVVMREPLGPVDELFPELPSGRILRVPGDGASRVPLAPEIFAMLLRRRAFVVNVGARHIPEALVRRVRRVARRRITSVKRREIARCRRQHVPLVWVSVRLHNRTFTEQRATLTGLLKALQRDYPRVGVVLDGFSVSADGVDGAGQVLKPREGELLVQQRTLVSDLRTDLGSGGPALIDTIGSSILESVLWAGAVDAYLTHHGTLQHKVGWLGNKPGVVHSNPAVLASNNRWVSGVRERGVAPLYIAADRSRDVSGGQGAAYNRNYAMDWTVLYEALQGVLRNCMRDGTTRASPSMEACSRRVTRAVKQAGLSLWSRLGR